MSEHDKKTVASYSEKGDRPVAVVTGASSGIGAATAVRLASEGFHVLLGARREEPMAKIMMELGPTVEYEKVDVDDEGSVGNFAARTERCDVLVCNAGIAIGLDEIWEAQARDWKQMFETNVLGVFRCVQAFLPKLRQAAAPIVIVVTSVSAYSYYRGGGGYIASKSALASLVSVLTIELADSPVRIVEIVPGTTKTAFFDARFGSDEFKKGEFLDGLTFLDPVDVADAICWAASRPSGVVVRRLELNSFSVK